MTTREYLEQITRLDSTVNNKLMELYQLKQLATSISAVSDSDVRVQSSGSQDRMGDMVAKIVDLEAEIEKSTTDYLDEKKKIIEQIESVKVNKYYDLLMLRYIKRDTFEQIAIDMGYSWRQVMNLHGEALQHFEKLYGAEYLEK